MADTTMHTLNTRIKLKYDSYQNWYDKNPVLLEGELAIAAIESTENNITTTGFANLPNIAIKVGNGTAPYRELKFISALAGDVHEWAKAADKPVYTAGEIQGLDAFIAGEIQDTDTRYTLLVEESAPWIIKLMATDPAKSDTTFDTEVARIDLSELDNRLKTVETALGEGGSVDTRIADAIGALTYADNQPVVAGAGKVFDSIVQQSGMVTVTTRELEIADVKGLQDAIDACQEDLPIDGTPSETNKVATQDTVNNAIKGLNNNDAAVAKQFVTGVKETEGFVEVTRRALEAADIPVIEQAQVNGLEDALDGKQENLTFDGEYNPETNPVATKASVTAAVAKLEGAMHFRGKVEGDTIDAAIAASDITDWAAGDVVLWGEYEFVFDGNDWMELGNTALYQLKSDAETQHNALQDAIDGLAESKQDVVPFENVPSEDDKVATTKSVIDRINEHMANKNFNGGAFGEHKFATKITETEGVIEAEYAQPQMADIAGLNDEIARVDKAIEDLDAAKQDNLPIDGTPAEDNKVATQSTVNTAIQNLTKADTAVDGQFVTSVSMVEGFAVPTRAAITTDHIQQGALTLVFDCGNATI